MSKITQYGRGMGAFTVLGDADLAAIADAFDLGTVRMWTAIAAGTINSNYALTTERASYFVRVNEGKSEADVAWEARLVHALAGHGLTTPPPRAARDGRYYAPIDPPALPFGSPSRSARGALV